MEREWTWEDCAKYCEENYGVYVDWEEEYFICPECDEPIYADDWDDHDLWNLCPICEFDYVKCGRIIFDDSDQDWEEEEEEE
jgi:hypothetical protein